MNKTTQLSILLLVCAVLLLGYNFISGDRTPTKVDEGQAALLKDFNPDAVVAVKLKKGATEIELKKNAEKKWVMPKQKNRPVLMSRIDDLLKNTKDAMVVKPRSSKNLDTFQLAPANRTEVTFEREAGKTKLFVGKMLEWSSSFVQREDGGSVLEIDKNLAQNSGVREEKSDFIIDPAYFFDLAVLSDTPEDAIAITITKNGEKGAEKTTVAKVIPGKGPVAAKQEIGKDEKPVWELTAPEKAPADDSKVSSLCSTLLKLTAKGYADDVAEKDTGLDKPAAVVEITLKDGTVREFKFGKMEKEESILAVSGKTDPYKVYKYVYDTATNTADLKKKEEKKDEEKKPDGATDVKPTQVEKKPEIKSVPAPETKPETKPEPKKEDAPKVPAPSVPAPTEKK